MEDSRSTLPPQVCGVPGCSGVAVSWCLCGLWCAEHIEGVPYDVVRRHPHCDC
jgi:hypothetical protein